MTLSFKQPVSEKKSETQQTQQQQPQKQSQPHPVSTESSLLKSALFRMAQTPEEIQRDQDEIMKWFSEVPVEYRMESSPCLAILRHFADRAQQEKVEAKSHEE